MNRNVQQRDRLAQRVGYEWRRDWPFAAAVAVSAGVLVYLAVTLTNSSLWLDELMSVYYSDPAHTASGEIWDRMSTDLHPPGYYIVLFLWRLLWGSSIVSVRSLSTLLMFSVLAIYAWHVVKKFGYRIAGFSVALIVVSQIFLVYAQEVRGYALLMLLTLTGAILYQSVSRHEHSFGSGISAIVFLCFLTETIHPYGVLWSGAICGGLLIFRRRPKERLIIVASGFLLLVYPIIRFAWMASLAEVHYNWFAFLNPWIELLFGLSRPLVIRQDFLVVGALAVALSWWIASRQIDWKKLATALPLLILIPLVVASALAIHFIIQPSFNDRNLVIIAPVIWLLVPYAIVAVQRSKRNDAIVAAGVVLLCVNHLARAEWLALGFKSEWRRSAALVESHAELCRDELVPVFHYVDPRRDRYFYRYYLQSDLQFHFVDRTELDGVLGQLAGSRCPIKFWAPHGLSPDAVAGPAELDGLGYEVARFDHAAQWENEPLQGAFVIIRRSE